MAKKKDERPAKKGPAAKPQPAAKKKEEGGKKSAAAIKPAAAKAAPAKPAGKSGRSSWLDAKKQTPVIEEKARHLQSFLEAMADGRIEDSELHDQEARLVSLMKEVEPQLDDALHEKVTRL